MLALHPVSLVCCGVTKMGKLFEVGQVVTFEHADGRRYTGRVTTTTRDHFSIRLEYGEGTASFYWNTVKLVEIVDENIWDMSHIPA